MARLKLVTDEELEARGIDPEDIRREFERSQLDDDVARERGERSRQATERGGRRRYEVPRPPTGYQSAADHTGKNTPEPPPSLIDGILRRGHKMMITAASKQGKSWLVTDLAWCIAMGDKLWGLFKCHRGRVLYVNAELDDSDFWRRVQEVAEAKGIPDDDKRGMLVAMHTRGQALTIDELVGRIIEDWEGRRLAAVIIDPIYKYESGSENDLETVRDLMAEIDRLTEALGCAVIYVHHHAKGAAGARDAVDRGAGTGGFARDYDAHLDLTRKQVREGTREAAILASHFGESARVYQAEFTLRSYREPNPLTVVWNWPLFVPTDDEVLCALPLVGSPAANSRKGGNATKMIADERRRRERALLGRALEECEGNGKPTTRANVLPIYQKLAQQAGETVPNEKTFKAWIAPSRGRLPYRVDTERGNAIRPVDDMGEFVEG